MNIGDRVTWTYKHSLNRKSKTYITKIGVIVGFTGAIKKQRYVSGSVAIVLFDGNKHTSKVLLKELEKAGV